MRGLLIHVWSKQNKTAIACLGLVPLLISCAATDVPEPPSDTTTSRAPEEAVVAEEPTAPQPDPTPSESSVIPMQFQGEWDLALEGCGLPVSEGRLQIGPDRIEFYESFGNVQEVITEGDLKMTVTAEYSSEGEIFTRTDSFELSSDRSTLTHSDTNSVRYRCPG